VLHAQVGPRYTNSAELAQRVVKAAEVTGIRMTTLPVL
jgi:formimidoylglutamate deiminase